jgi:Nif-specific regulatory protein
MSGKEIVDALDLKLLPIQPRATSTQPENTSEGLPRAVHDIELKALKDALARTGWRQAAAARLLGITPRQIGYKISKYGLIHPDDTGR